MTTPPPQYSWMPVAKDDCKEGDEHFWIGEWVPCDGHKDVEGVCGREHRRRRITAPEGYRILGEEEKPRGVCVAFSTQSVPAWQPSTWTEDQPLTIKELIAGSFPKILAIAEPISQEKEQTMDRKGATEKAMYYGVDELKKSLESPSPMNPQPVAPGPAISEETEKLLTFKSDALEHFNPALVMEEMHKTQGITRYSHLSNQERTAYKYASQWAYKVIKSLKEHIDHLNEIIADELTPLPPPWQRISETTLPEPNNPFHFWDGKYISTSSKGMAKPKHLVPSNYTHFIMAEGIYQIPPPPVEETKPAWRIWFDKEVNDPKNNITIKYEEEVALHFTLAALRAAKARPELLENL